MHRFGSLPLFWRLQIVSWTLFALAIIPIKLAAFPVSVALALTVIREPLGFLLSCGLRRFYLWIGADGFRGGRLVATVIIASIVAGAVDMAAGRWVGAWFGHPEEDIQSLGIFAFRGTLYIAWSLLYFWIKAQRAAQARELRLARAETVRREAELQLLRTQVNPHFLFNALNTILATLAPDQTRPRRVVEGLAAYLRYSLQHRHDAAVPLGAEYDATVNYLAVEQERFRDELLVECRIDDALRPVPVPGVLLQPLVENAVKYSRHTSDPPYRVRLEIDASPAGALNVVVANTGSWVDPPASAGPHGTGLENLRRRLALLYPGTHELTTSQADGWVRVRLRIPAAARRATTPVHV